MSRRPALLQSRQVEIGLGIVALLGAAWLIRDAYEGRGRKRPLAVKTFLP